MKRNPRLRRTSAWLVACSAVLGAPVWSAKVIDVRIGHEPTFTRIVFELDAPAGYRLERNEADDGTEEVVVSLDASAEALSLPVESPLVEMVVIEPGPQGAVAHIRLKESGFRLKEMFVAEPPEIVIDVLAPEPPVAQLDPEPVPESEEAAELASLGDPRPEESADPLPEPMEAAPEALAMPAPDPVEEPEAMLEPPAEVVELAAVVEPPAEAVHELVPERERAATPVPPAAQTIERMPAEPPAALPFGIPADFARIGMFAGGGLGLLLLVFLLLRKRRSRRGGSPAVAPVDDVGDDEYFRQLDGEQSVGGKSNDGAADEIGAQPGPVSVASPSLGGMDPAGSGGPSAGLAMGGAGPTSGAGAGPEASRQVQDVEQRVAQLESRLHEASEARERLEGRVAAQTEESRVQRAAIARTQRAIRNLGRSDSEDSATEPAPRDPETPNPSRAE